jgi:uncharacterized protein (UPF0335 family)
MSQVKTYATELAAQLREIEKVQEAVKDIIASAKDAGINTRVLRKLAREIVMESDKRAKLYDDEDQLSLFRTEVGLTQGFAEAAE